MKAGLTDETRELMRHALRKDLNDPIIMVHIDRIYMSWMERLKKRLMKYRPHYAVEVSLTLTALFPGDDGELVRKPVSTRELGFPLYEGDSFELDHWRIEVL